jgi:hypothetical protein
MNLKIVHLCEVCRIEQANMKKCSECKLVRYCSIKCQKTDWIKHKNECKVNKKSSKLLLVDFKSKIKMDHKFLDTILNYTKLGTIIFHCKTWKLGDDFYKYMKFYSKQQINTYSIISGVNILENIVYFDIDDEIVMVGIDNLK